jgi:FkbM family methyltransferase
LQTDVGRLLLPETDQVLVPWIQSRGTWSPEDGNFMRQHVRPGMAALDVGAHCGYFALLLAQLVGPGGSVVAVEPEPGNHALLRENVSHAGLDNVRIIHAAAWRRSGSVPISISPDNSGDHRAYEFDSGRKTIEVPALALDDLDPPLAALDFVKLDAQGTEHHALEGMRETIARFRPLMLVEFWPDGIRDGGDDPEAVLAMYRELGYDVKPLPDPGRKSDLTPAELLEIVEEKGFDSIVLEPAHERRSSGTADSPAPTPVDGQPARDPLKPLLVVSPGRSGSTLIMRFLGTSPEIAMERAYPFEALYYQYLLRLSRLIDSPSLPHWERTHFVSQMRNPTVSDGLVGPPPWPARLRTVEGLGDSSMGQRMLLACWREFSAQARLRDAEAIWWAEKAPVASRVEAGGPLNARMLFLVRDPRDVLLSWDAFDQARDPAVVAQRPRGPRTVAGFVRGSRRFLTRAKAGFHVRYEDAVSRPDEVARSLSEWLDVEVSVPAAVDAGHLTSESPERSVGRWEREMDEKTKEICARELGPLLSEFGYRV